MEERIKPLDGYNKLDSIFYTDEDAFPRKEDFSKERENLQVIQDERNEPLGMVMEGLD